MVDQVDSSIMLNQVPSLVVSVMSLLYKLLYHVVCDDNVGNVSITDRHWSVAEGIPSPSRFLHTFELDDSRHETKYDIIVD